MLLPIHIAIALISVVYSVYALFSPSKNKLYAVYAQIALTLLTGSLLVMLRPAHMAQVCQTGLAYIAAMALGISLMRNKITKQQHHARNPLV